MIHRPRLSDGSVRFRRKSAELTPAEYAILERLLQRTPHYVKWSELYECVTDREATSHQDKVVTRVHIYNLRRKIRKAEMEMSIESRPHWGYRLWY